MMTYGRSPSRAKLSNGDRLKMYVTAINRFLRDECVGGQYGSCIDSPCPLASADRCQHPLHPKNRRAHNQ